MQQMWEPLPEQLHSFPNFVCYLLREQGLASTPTKQQVAVAKWMQDGPDRTLTVAFRGLGKSLLAVLLRTLAAQNGPGGEDPGRFCYCYQDQLTSRSSCCGRWLKSTSCSVCFLGQRIDSAMSPLMLGLALLNRAHQSELWALRHRPRDSAVPAQSWTMSRHSPT